MTKLWRSTAAIVLLSSAAGCINAPVEGGQDLQLTYATQRALFDEADGQADRTVRDNANLPTTGQVAYSGYMEFDVQDFEGANFNVLVGTLAITADFETDTVSGSAGNFVDLADQTYSGELMVQNGNFNRDIDRFVSDNPTIAGDLNGTLTGSTGKTYDLTSNFGAEFNGAASDQIFGIMAGTAISDGLSLDAEGILVAEQQGAALE